MAADGTVTMKLSDPDTHTFNGPERSVASSIITTLFGLKADFSLTNPADLQEDLEFDH